MKKSSLFAVLFVGIVGVTTYIQFMPQTPKKVVSPVSIAVKQIVQVGEQKKNDSVSVRKQTTALTLLRTTHKISTQGEGVNAFISSIDERSADVNAHEFWAFYVNGKQATVGAGSYILKNNDTIEWKIETYSL